MSLDLIERREFVAMLADRLQAENDALERARERSGLQR